MIANDYFEFTSDIERTAYLYIGGGYGGTMSIGSMFISSDSRWYHPSPASLTNVMGRVYNASKESTANDTISENANVVIQTNGSRQTIEIDIPHMYTTSRLIPFSPLFIESLLIHPGDVVTFDLSADTGTPFVGLSPIRFDNPAGITVKTMPTT